ncbi:MAG TPA: hypothetical protein VNH15_04840 [Elusimicrobiota bacterium]|nr:hypothetical protein [Elusimicrobiota bacterium]
MRRLTPDEFIQKAKTRHGDKYDYSKVTHVYASEKLPIICPNHGVFHQRPHGHLSGQGCPRCAGRIIDADAFVKRAVQIHGDKYKYTKVRYSNGKEKVIITCPKHGDFLQSPSDHFSGYGCARCAGNSRLTQEEFVAKAGSIHGGRYSYQNVNYINAKTKVCITCPQHGDFFQEPGSHLSGNGCRRCAGTSRLTQEEFVAKAKAIHGNLYSYQKVVYVSNKTPVVIVCKKHGDFQQAPTNHLRRQGCDKCVRVKQADKMRWTLDEFLKKARARHGTKYAYDKVNYVDWKTKVTITCPIHGDFKQVPQNHWRKGSGCPRCAGKLINTETFLMRANKVHGNKYSYKKTIFTRMRDKIVITCKFHGDFLQSAGHHLQGQGCKRCRIPRGESVIESYLKENGIDYEWEYSPVGLPAKRKLRYDFCVKINGHIGLIEYHGVQHYKPISFGGGASDYEGGLERDRVKAEYAKENNIPFLVISHKNFDLINNSLADFIAKMRRENP